jgi:hypothetical protein
MFMMKGPANRLTIRTIDGFPKRLGLLAGALILAITLSPIPAQAQQKQATDDPSSAASPKTIAATTADLPDAPQPASAIKDDRIFGVMPNYSTVENQDQFGPISTKGKYMLSVKSTFDPYTFAFIGFASLIGQAENSEPSYGQGLKGYAKRYGTSYADALIGTFMTTSVAPSLLKQDPRYFQLGHGSIWHRAVYSASRMIVTRSDSGNRQFNYSEIGGNLVAAGISNLYHPQEDRTITNTMSVWGTDIMWDAVSDELKEFWPDIRRKLARHKPPLLPDKLPQ